MFFRKFIAAKLFLVVPVVLSACGGSTISISEAWDSQQPEVRKHRDNFGHVEVVLDPVKVWDDKNASAPVSVKIGGQNLFMRKYGGDIFDKAWAQMGLFWHSKSKNIVVPIVVFELAVKIHQVEIRTSEQQALLPMAEDFDFTPGKLRFDSRPMSSAAFVMPPQLLEAIVNEKIAQLIIKTDRGNMHVGLDVVHGDAEADLRRNAKYLFALFADTIREVQND